MFRRFGSKVTVIQSGSQLLKEEDQDVAEEVLKILRQDGIEILLDARTERVARANGEISLTIALEGKAQIIAATDLMVNRPGTQHRGSQACCCGDRGRPARFYPVERPA